MENLHETSSRSEPLPPSSPHDKLFKAVFKRTDYARAFLAACLPERLLARLDLSTLRPSDTGRVDSNFEENFSDIQLTCDTYDGEQVEIVLILEHKSYIPRHGSYQYMHYQDGVWGMQLQEKDAVPTPVVPVLIYHGPEGWQPKPWKDYLKGWHEVFAPYTPPGGCVFVPLHGMSDEKIKRFRYGFMVAALLLLKHRLERDYLLENLPKIFNFVECDPAENDIDNRIENLKYALRYLQGLTAIKWKEAKDSLRSLNLTFQTMDVLDEVKYEGVQEGIEIGVEKGIGIGVEKGIEIGAKKEKFFSVRSMLRKNFAQELIAEVQNVTLDYIADVAKQMKKEPEIARLLEQGKTDPKKIADALKVSPFLVEAVKRDMNDLAA
ncbi:MAG TPA: hypothetical protein ENJ95_03175 [Bacteroidetes bacterium]|nr:hypothetical protein [Bacteroidota bacterium]